MDMGSWSVPAVLAIAGSDSSGGAGIQADIKTIAAHGLFAETAITALTAQNTCGVRDVMEATPQMAAALALAERLGCAVLVKGGHGVADANDVLVEPAESGGTSRVTWLRAPRVETGNTHGTGCTLSSAIAANLAKGFSLEDSVERAKTYLSGALAAMLDLGHGSGPMDHAFDIKAEYRMEARA